MENQNKNSFMEVFHDTIVKRKAMFIPLMCVAAFGLVGYVAVDKEAPVIEASQVEVLYGTTLDKTMFSISDNRDDLESLEVQIVDHTYDAYSLGEYDVNVIAIDMFSNTTEKTVNVKVVDKTAPVISINDHVSGYVIPVEVGDSNKIKDYVSAIDNVDGDVTSFIETDKTLNTSVKGTQTLKVSVSDSSGNTANKDVEFYVTDTSAPILSYKKGKTITVDYGSSFNYKDYIKVKDNYDKASNLKVSAEGKVDTKKVGTYELTIKVADSEGNLTTGTLKVNVKDISAPVISLSKSSVQVQIKGSFDPKAYLSKVFDNLDGNLKDKVTIQSNVNTKREGEYSVTYTVKDEAGNKTTKTLKVSVVDPNATSNIASAAASRVGSAYVYGATGPNRFDCSGLAQWSYRQNGKYIPRTAASQYSYTKRVSWNNLKPGDLVFFSGTTNKSGITHVGIYVGGGQFVHAGTPSTGVRKDNLNSSYWRYHFVSGGRV